MAVAAFDVVVAGGGPAGSVAARRLATAGRSVLVLDARAPARRRRVGEALPPAVRPLLRDLGLWERFCSEGHRVCPGNDSAWGSARLASTDFVFDPNGHGWHLERDRFDDWLRAEARAVGGEVRGGRVAAASRADDGWIVRLDGEDEVRSRWIVDATGRPSVLARRHGGRRRAFDAAVALVGEVRAAAGDCDSRTLVEAGANGWWYTALLPGGRRVVAYVTDRDLVPAEARTRSGFAGLMASTNHVRERVGSAMLVRAPHQVAAGSARLEPVRGEGWVAVGDAALAVDPLSSQGILNALATGMWAAEAIETGDVSAYVARVDEIDDLYRRNLATYYGMERRWPGSAFWQRRADD